MALNSREGAGYLMTPGPWDKLLTPPHPPFPHQENGKRQQNLPQRVVRRLNEKCTA